MARKVNGAVQKGYLWQGQLRIVAELDASGQVTSRFIYGTKVNVPEYMLKGGATYRLITDQLGSVRLVVNASTGAVAQRIDYDEFGVVTSDTSPGFTPFGFAGGLYDPDTKLVRFGARDYDAETGRWTIRDPILFEGGSENLFGYVLSDPVNNTDYSGLTVTCTYSQATGNLTCTDDTTGAQVVNENGYAGRNVSGGTQGRNNPDAQCEVRVGPPPRGPYTLGTGVDGTSMGPNAIPMTPDASNDMCGRGGFYIHGDNSGNDASQGCIIMGSATRRTITNSGGGTLTVTR